MGDRPVECGQCKKPTVVLYKEIVGDLTTCTEMCTGCPILSAKLHGESSTGKLTEKESSLCCGNCGTSVESIKRESLSVVANVTRYLEIFLSQSYWSQMPFLLL
ncbi:MAG: hypothetical protein LVR00_09490 [Rhabdochlamydiaceae bacterium]